MSEEQQKAELDSAGAGTEGGKQQLVADDSKQPSGDRRYVPPPEWFDMMLANMLSLYPSSVVRPQTLHVWWAYLGNLPPQALEQAFGGAPRRSGISAIPSAELVRQLAVAWLEQQKLP